MTVQDLEARLITLSHDEKVRVFGQLSLDLIKDWPGIEKTLDINGGDACIVRTRIPVWVIELYGRGGWSEERLLDNFPTLRRADIVFARLYAASHKDEIEQAIREHEDA